MSSYKAYNEVQIKPYVCVCLIECVTIWFTANWKVAMACKPSTRVVYSVGWLQMVQGLRNHTRRCQWQVIVRPQGEVRFRPGHTDRQGASQQWLQDIGYDPDQTRQPGTQALRQHGCLSGSSPPPHRPG